MFPFTGTWVGDSNWNIMQMPVKVPGGSERKMVSKANRVLTVGITWLVIVLGCYLFAVARPNPREKWEQLAPLPEQAASIEWTNFGYLLAHTDHGISYQAYPQQDEPWSLHDETAENPYGEPCQAEDGGRFNPPPFPGEPISQSSADCFASAESQYYGVAVLLDSNEVWVWTHLYSGVSEAFRSYLFMGAGCLGVVILMIGGALKLYDG